MLQALRRPQTKKAYQRAAGLWSFYFSLNAAHYHAIRPLHVAAFSGISHSPLWLELFEHVVTFLPTAVPFDFVPVLRDVFADDSSSGLGICFAIGNVVILTDAPATIYRRELWAVLFALLLEPPQTRVLTDNRAVYHALTKGRKGKGL